MEHTAAPADLTDLEYILKNGKLHYSSKDQIIEIRNHYRPGSSEYDSFFGEERNNIVIPKGATGNCIFADADRMIIDFGKGVLVPFVLHDQTNRAADTLRIESREYILEGGKQESRLYFKLKMP